MNVTNNAAKDVGVIGWPIQHSKSPLIHKYWIEKYNMAARYHAIAIAPHNLEREVKNLAAAGFSGFNVTLPYKQAIIPLLDFIRADAERIGAVNTVVIGADGRMEGRNTDAFGFIENLKAGVPDFDFTRGPAIVLGAGGAARAVVYALMRVGVPEIRIFNRTIKKAEMLAGCFECSHAYDWGLLGKYMADSHLLVNATSAGMAGAEDLDIDLKTLPATALVHDVVYVPLETDLLRQARLRGNPTVTGIGMLLHQARPAFQAWFGVLPEVDATLTAQVLG